MEKKFVCLFFFFINARGWIMRHSQFVRILDYINFQDEDLRYVMRGAMGADVQLDV